MAKKKANYWKGWADRLRALSNVPPVLRLVWDSGPGVVATGLIFRVIVALIPLAMLGVSRWIIDAVVGTVSGKHPLRSDFWWLVGLEFALAMLAGALGRVVDFCDTLLGDKYTRYVSVRVMQHASQLDLSSYEDPAFYDKLERARVQATDRLATIQATGRLIQLTITTVSLSASIFFFSPWLLLLLVVCVVPAFLGESHFAFLNYSLSIRQTPVKRQLDYLRVLGASKEAAKELKLFGLRGFLTDRYKHLFSGIYRQNAALARKRLVAGALLSVAGTLGYYGAYAWVILETVRGQLSVGTMTFLAGALAGASTNIQNMFSTFSSIADQALFFTDLLQFFEFRPKVISKPNALPAPRPIRSGFEFHNVSFTYPGTERNVLDGLSFRLEPGVRMALIGENGQGKTTIVKLLARLYDPTGGTILLDGVDLREYDIEDLCKEIGVIFQDFMHYDLTAAENIAVGRIEEKSNRQRIEAAAAKSLADQVIDRLPMKYDQMLGRKFEGGVDLSGGEWQKLAIARAYLRDAQVLVLDEPTAALDARSEFEVFQNFAELTEGKMALLISHRFSTVRMSDRILVLENGRIAEDGSHDRLMELGGRYSEMFELQAMSYR
jgi:ATP-binding cassette, subfamily B, bacterial